VLRGLVGRVEAKFPKRPFETGIAGGCYGRDSLLTSESIRESRARRGFAASRRKSFTGILGGVTEQNILRETIFV
jgi:hypothetical protein